MAAGSLIIAGIMTAFSALPLWAEEIREKPSMSRHEQQHERKGNAELKKACDCCKACMNAKKPVTGKEEGPPARDGCRECCERCGHDKVPTEEQLPPEIVK